MLSIFRLQARPTRCSYRQKLVHILNDSSLSVVSDSALFTQITLDWSVVVQEYCVKDFDTDKIELWSREMISDLHYARLRLLNTGLPLVDVWT